MMKQTANKISCPNCGEEIDVNDILYHQVDEALKRKYREELAKERNNYQNQLTSMNEERQKLAQAREKQDLIVAEKIKQGIRAEEKRLKTTIKADLAEEQSHQLKSLHEELNEKSSQLKEFNKAKSDIERLKREKNELKESIEAESEKRLNEKISEERDKIIKIEGEKSLLKLAEREKVIRQLNEKLKAAQRQAEQGSMQTQGEVQELAIEEWLAGQFPMDTIEEIKKGARGADCLQRIHTRTRQNCGTIYYESKRTKGFQPGWIEKFKKDIREKNADIGVLVTESMPTDMERMGIKEGIWICTFMEFKGLCVALRESIIRVSQAIAIQDNKGDKMGMLYDFLTGNEFRLQIEAIVEGFNQLQTDLESEKRAMMGIWKKREKQIQKVLLNTNHMYNSVKGIAGNAIQSIPLLELPEAGEEETKLL
ncbi:MAG: DUF2130 domain-containing protein [Nitrospira sp.]|nr:DUF2130 domain-containing protein [Candidatus Manganitrophaceae bacterium]HIL34180.1 DUF2130 domain-containing protein [Candidatus Manganitrophaceae bacterium]